MKFSIGDSVKVCRPNKCLCCFKPLILIVEESMTGKMVEYYVCRNLECPEYEKAISK